MAEIKAGTYRFNDVLTVPSELFSVDLIFTVNGILSIDDDGEVVSLSEGFSACTELQAGLSDIFTDGYMVMSFVTEDSPFGAIPAYDERYGFDAIYTGFTNQGFTVQETLKGYGQTITIPEDTEVSPEFYAWFAANTVEQKQISGKWKWKDELTWPSFDAGYHDFPIDFSIVQSFTESQVQEFVDFLAAQGVANSIVVQPYTLTTNYSGFELFVSGTESSSEEGTYWILDYKDAVVTSKPYDAEVINFAGDMFFDVNEAYSSFNGWHDFGDLRGLLQTIDFGTEPQTVSAEFYEWLTANATQPTATITYNGATIATLNGGQTATIKCAGNKMKSDIVVEVAEQTGGECSGTHVIEVDELPTENIDENALYSCDGKYYKWANEFVDLFICMEEEVVSLTEVMGADSSLTYHIAPTKPTENIAVSSLDGDIHLYYIEDENNVFLYGDFEGTGNNVWIGIEVLIEGMSFNGVIANVSEITEEGWYALVEKGFLAYVYTNGTLKITENGTYDVADKASVMVNIDNEAVVGCWEIDPSNGLGSVAFCQKVDFTDTDNGGMAYYDGIKYAMDSASNYLYYTLGNESYLVYSAVNGWESGKETAILNFGAEPQIVGSTFKNLLTTYATPKYTIVPTE